ncbi:flagellin [Caldibacillus lycopersici]|uniref:Flagellin n=1 Tax=Perspicuibacillus lycopersici TaxID=1325689 RepID=A0AAE3IT51_9BACI|nr:flagellin [Perspicuibacillus lycopersici]MCU9612981.1 flagellin [Perspicuibacillus lycopersici]
MRINHNITALGAHRNLTGANNAQAKSMEKLSSGLRINRAADDAAGLAISEKMRSQIKGLDMGAKNAQDGISLIQTAEGALNETHSILQRMRELSVQAGNETNTSTDVEKLQAEADQLAEEITRISSDTEFNKGKLLNGSAGSDGTVTLQIGANAGQSISVQIGTMDASTILGSATLDISSSTAIGSIDAAIETVSTQRSKLGAVQNRLEHTINNLSTSSENLTAAESRIRDVDMAKEMMEQTKNSILAQASQAMLAQANQQPQGVLQLLQ